MGKVATAVLGRSAWRRGDSIVEASRGVYTGWVGRALVVNFVVNAER